jgi:hypothetical protein
MPGKRIAVQIDQQHVAYAIRRDAARRTDDAGVDIVCNLDRSGPVPLLRERCGLGSVFGHDVDLERESEADGPSEH